MSPNRIRLASAEEWGEVADLLIAARRAAEPAIPPSVHPDDEVREWVRDHLVPTHDVWVVDDGDALLAVMALSDRWIDQLYLDPNLTGQGLGSLLVDHAKSVSTGSLELWTFASNVGAQRFYERHGFSEVERTAGDNEEGEPDIRYLWRRSGATRP